MKLKNAKDWKTSVMAIIAGVIIMGGIFWPEKIDPETSEVIKTAANEIVTGVATLVTIIIGIFFAKDK